MACYHPIDAWRARAGVNSSGKVPLVFSAAYGDPETAIKVPCGQCSGCRLERSRQWAVRCIHEASLHKQNCFLTLTYCDEALHLQSCPDLETGEVIGQIPTLYPRDIVLFMKRLRKKYGAGIRFFQCGEYGEKYSRPHHHMIVFGFDFPDKQFLQMSNGIPLYMSPSLLGLWPHGHHSIGTVTFESAAYVARYIMKKINGDLKDPHYRGRVPDYITMSRRPGIAHDWFDKFADDVYPADQCVIRTSDGPPILARPPKYYDRIYDAIDPVAFAAIKDKRMQAAKESPDNTPERLAVREEVQISRAKRLVRPIE